MISFFSLGKKGIMKLKVIFLALLFSMCSSSYKANQDQVKIISLSTTHTEIIDQLDAESQLVGIDSFYKTDLLVKRFDAFTVTAEELLLLNPDLVLVAFDFNGIIEGLEKNNINYVFLPPARNLEDVYFQIETIGELVGKKSKAVETTREMKIKINDIINNSSLKGVSVFHEIGYTYGIYTVNKDSLIGEIYNLLGVDNIANFEEDPYGSGYPEFQEKKIIKENPQYIVVGHSDYLNKDLSTRSGWGQITAVKNGNVVYLDENLANNWGTTTVALIENISDVFEESNQTHKFSESFVLISLLFLVITTIMYLPNKKKELV